MHCAAIAAILQAGCRQWYPASVQAAAVQAGSCVNSHLHQKRLLQRVGWEPGHEAEPQGQRGWHCELCCVCRSTAARCSICCRTLQQWWLPHAPSSWQPLFSPFTAVLQRYQIGAGASAGATTAAGPHAPAAAAAGGHAS